VTNMTGRQMVDRMRAKSAELRRQKAEFIDRAEREEMSDEEFDKCYSEIVARIIDLRERLDSYRDAVARARDHALEN